MQHSISLLFAIVAALCYFFAQDVETSAVDLNKITNSKVEEMEPLSEVQASNVESRENVEEYREDRQGLVGLLDPNKHMKEATKTVFVQVTKVLTKHPICMTVHGVKPPCLPRPPEVYLHKPMPYHPPPPPPHKPHHPPPHKPQHPPPHHHVPEHPPPHAHHPPPPPPPHVHHPAPHGHHPPPPAPPKPIHEPHPHPPHEPHKPDCYREHEHGYEHHHGEFAIEPTGVVQISGITAGVDDVLVIPGLKEQDTKSTAPVGKEAEESKQTTEEKKAPSARQGRAFALEGSLLDDDEVDFFDYDDDDEPIFIAGREEIEGSLLETPALEASKARLILGNQETKIVTKTLWVTKIKKVTDYGVTATLVAHNCIPTNNKIPLCAPNNHHHKPVHHPYKGSDIDDLELKKNENLKETQKAEKETEKSEENPPTAN